MKKFKSLRELREFEKTQKKAPSKPVEKLTHKVIIFDAAGKFRLEYQMNWEDAAHRHRIATSLEHILSGGEGVSIVPIRPH